MTQGCIVTMRVCVWLTIWPNLISISDSHCFPPAQRAVPGQVAAATQAISYHLPLNIMMRTTKPMGWASIVALYQMESSKLMSQHLCEKNRDFLRRNGKHLLHSWSWLVALWQLQWHWHWSMSGCLTKMLHHCQMYSWIQCQRQTGLLMSLRSSSWLPPLQHPLFLSSTNTGSSLCGVYSWSWQHCTWCVLLRCL